MKEKVEYGKIIINDNYYITRLDKHCLALMRKIKRTRKETNEEYWDWEIAGYHGDLKNALYQAVKEVTNDTLFDKDINIKQKETLQELSVFDLDNLLVSIDHLIKYYTNLAMANEGLYTHDTKVLYTNARNKIQSLEHKKIEILFRRIYFLHHFKRLVPTSHVFLFRNYLSNAKQAQIVKGTIEMRYTYCRISDNRIISCKKIFFVIKYNHK